MDWLEQEARATGWSKSALVEDAIEETGLGKWTTPPPVRLPGAELLE